jgi:hypothetical protein
VRIAKEMKLENPKGEDHLGDPGVNVWRTLIVAQLVKKFSVFYGT